MLKAMDILLEKNHQMIFVDKNTKIVDAVKIMNEMKVGAILIKDGDSFIGIWTERDLLKNVLKPEFNIENSLITDYMTKNLLSAKHDSSIYQLYDIFLGKKIRHLLIEKDEEFIGIISQGDVVKASLNEKTKEIEDLNNILKWEYYENWRFNWKNK